MPDVIVRFWGVRGSIPSPGKYTAKYGGNTPCIELRFGNKLIIVDAGSGIRLLGKYLVMSPDFQEIKKDVIIFLTHTHWDHIQGIPFFLPLFLETNITFFGPYFYNRLKNIIAGQMGYIYFPVKLEEVNADINFIELEEENFELFPELKIQTIFLNHSVICLGYKFTYKGKSVVTLFDFEIGASPDDIREGKLFTQMTKIIGPRRVHNLEDFIAFAYGADILIIDSQYTPEEYKKRKGWGHSSIIDATNFAIKSAVKNLVLYHHDPNRSDAELDKINKVLNELLKKKGYKGIPRIIIASEGMTLKI